MIVPTRHAGLEAMYCRYALTVANHPKGFFFEALIILAVLPTDFCLFHTHSKVSDFCMRINGAISFCTGAESGKFIPGGGVGNFDCKIVVGIVGSISSLKL